MLRSVVGHCFFVVVRTRTTTEFGRYVILPHHPVGRHVFPSGAEGCPDMNPIGLLKVLSSTESAHPFGGALGDVR